VTSNAKLRDPDVMAAWATGIGIGLIAHMLTWLIGNRLTALIWEAPVGPIVAFSLAIVVGIAISIVAAKRLAAGVRAAAM